MTPLHSDLNPPPFVLLARSDPAARLVYSAEMLGLTTPGATKRPATEHL